MDSRFVDFQTDDTEVAANKRVALRTEGDINLSKHRVAWYDNALNIDTKRLLAEDAGAFVHQAMSTPCLNALRSAEGAWIEDVEGRRYLDFHGNNVHQLGLCHPQVIAAIKQQLDQLPFCTRRYTNELRPGRSQPRAVRAEWCVGNRHRAQAGARRDRAVQDHLALLVLDEIPIGLGRTGRFFAFEHFDVIPDIVVLGKGLGGGVFPLAGILAREHLNIAAEQSLGHYTHEKNPVACAAGLATLEVIEQDRLVERAAELGTRTAADLRGRLARNALVREVRSLGLLLGVEIAGPKQGAADVAEQVMYEALRRGLNFKVSKGNVLTFAPPLNIAEKELDQAWHVLEEVLKDAGRLAGKAATVKAP